MAKKGQTFKTYTEGFKREVVRLKLEEKWSYKQLREHIGIKSDAQIANWVTQKTALATCSCWAISTTTSRCLSVILSIS